MTPTQQQHARSARAKIGSNVPRRFNAGKPAVVAAPRPFTRAATPPGAVPINTSDRTAGGPAHRASGAKRARCTAGHGTGTPFIPTAADISARRSARGSSRPSGCSHRSSTATGIRAPAATECRRVHRASRCTAGCSTGWPAAVIPAAAATRPVTSIPVFVHHAPAVPAAPAAPVVRAPIVRAPAPVPPPVRPAAVAVPAQVRPGG